MNHEKTKNIRRLEALPRASGGDMASGCVIAGWALRHAGAVRLPKPGLELATVELFRGWLRYADAHQEAYGSGIGEDGVLGPLWAQIGVGLRGLLNGDLGRLDGGTLDRILCEALRGQEMNPDDL